MYVICMQNYRKIVNILLRNEEITKEVVRKRLRATSSY